MKIKITKNSRWTEKFIEDNKFGTFFSDHMLIQNYKNGQWEIPEIKAYENLSLPPSLHSLHYGQSIFEGMKAFKNDNEEIFLFRPNMNARRFNKSAERMCMPKLEEKVFITGIKELIKLDHKWVPKLPGSALYIRPFMFSSSELIKAVPSREYTFVIITCPVKSYYTGGLNLKIEINYSRAAKGGTGGVKAAGNYGASFYAAKNAQNMGFDQLIWTDNQNHQFIEEVGTMNIFFVKNKQLITPKLNDSILPGITRDSIIRLAKFEGIKCHEQDISIQELIEEYHSGNLTEAFGAGTAVSISSINSITYKDLKLEFNPQKNIFSEKLKVKLQDIQYGHSKDPFAWRNKIF